MPIDRPDWGAPTKDDGRADGVLPGLGGRWTRGDTDASGNVISATSAAPVAGEEKLTAATTTEAGADDSALHRKLVDDGVMTLEEVAKHYALSRDEIEALKGPPPARPSVEDEQHRRLAQQDDRELAPRYVELLELRDKRDEANGRHTGWREQEKKGEVEKKTDEEQANVSLVDSDGSDLPTELLEQWDKQGGRDFHLKQAQATTRAILDGIEDEAERGEMTTAFDALSPSIRNTVIAHLAVPPTGGREATEQEIEKFKSHEEGAELIAEWGRHAARNIRTANGRIKTILGALSPEDRSTASEFLGSLSPGQAKAMFRAIVAGK